MLNNDNTQQRTNSSIRQDVPTKSWTARLVLHVPLFINGWQWAAARTIRWRRLTRSSQLMPNLWHTNCDMNANHFPRAGKSPSKKYTTCGFTCPLRGPGCLTCAWFLHDLFLGAKTRALCKSHELKKKEPESNNSTSVPLSILRFAPLPPPVASKVTGMESARHPWSGGWRSRGSA